MTPHVNVHTVDYPRGVTTAAAVGLAFSWCFIAKSNFAAAGSLSLLTFRRYCITVHSLLVNKLLLGCI
jgi:hypothetical protein